MVERRALVLIDGRIHELPGDDTLLGVGSGFRLTPDRVDDTHAVYFYFGWLATSAESWRIRRQLRSDSSVSDATGDSNPGHATLADAWPSRAGLTYG